MMSASLDLWAMIMLGSGAVAATGLLGLAITRTGPKATAATWVGNAGLLGVLAGALLGTTMTEPQPVDAVAVREAPPAKADESPTAEDEAPVQVAGQPEPADPAGVPEDSADVEANGPPAEPDSPEPAEPDSPEPAEPTEPAADAPPTADAPEPGDAPPPGDAPEPAADAPAPSGDWPEDPEALKTAVRTLLAEAKAVATDEARCKDAAVIGSTWAKVATVPADVYPDRVEAVRARLEECRKKLLWATRYSVRKDRVAARETFATDLKKSLADQELRAIVTAHGRDNELLRIGSTLIDEAKAKEMLDGSLTAEAAKLGFQKVTIANGKSNYVRELEATLDQSVIDSTLAEHELDQPFAR